MRKEFETYPEWGANRIASESRRTNGRPQLRIPFVEHPIELTYNEGIKRPLRAGRAERIK